MPAAPRARRVAVLGATGYVGGLLVPALADAGHDVVALARRPHEVPARDGVRALAADVDDEPSLRRALRGVDVAFYLAHLLGHDDLVAREVAAAQRFARAAAAGGVRQVVSVGGLVPPDLDPSRLSPHLQGRTATEDALRDGEVPVTAVRAAVVVGPGSAGWEVLRQIATALPLMAAPRRARARSQPIAQRDLVGFLLAVLGQRATYDQVVEVGGPDVVTYRELVARVQRGLGRPGVVPEVLVVPRVVQEAAVRQLTDVDPDVAMDLLESAGHDAVVSDERWLHLLPHPPTSLDEAIRHALAAT
ncbi:hypothetical protein GCM10027446_09690 [Angustibacter peucedani]